MDVEYETLEEIQERVLWLATNMVEHANHVRPNPDGVKVGGHQASCASMVTLMTALYLHHLDADDFVASGDQRLRQVRPDEASSSGDNDLHIFPLYNRGPA